MSDAVAFMGFSPFSKAIPNANKTSLAIGSDTDVRAFFKTNEIALGAENPAEFVALATKVLNELQTIVSAIVGGVPVAMDGGAALQTTIVAALNNPVPSIAATKVKAE